MIPCLCRMHHLITGTNSSLTEALKRLEIEVVASSYDQAYSQGHTTQVPTGRVVGVKRRVSRKIGYDGKYVTFEYVS